MSVSTYDTDKDFINILLVGKTGDGKSSTCNTIMGQKKFQSKASFSSTTKKCQRALVRIQGHNLVVVDSPGLADTDITSDGGLKQLGDEIVNIFATEPDGFDAILIVVRYGRKYSAEDKRVFKELHLLFGKEYVMEHGILLVTHKDKYEPEENGNLSIHEFMMNQKGLFPEMLEQCNNRVVYFDNDTKDESICKAQVKQLLDMAVKTKQIQSSVTPEVVLKARETRDKANKETEKPVIEKDTLKGLWLIIYSLEEISSDCRDVQFFKKTIEALHKRCQELKDQDKSTGRLKNVIASVSRLEETIKLRIAAIEKNRNIAEVAEDISEAIKALELLLEESEEAQQVMLNIYLARALRTYLAVFFTALRHEADPISSRQTSCALQ